MGQKYIIITATLFALVLGYYFISNRSVDPDEAYADLMQNNFDYLECSDFENIMIGRTFNHPSKRRSDEILEIDYVDGSREMELNPKAIPYEFSQDDKSLAEAWIEIGKAVSSETSRENEAREALRKILLVCEVKVKSGVSNFTVISRLFQPENGERQLDLKLVR